MTQLSDCSSPILSFILDSISFFLHPISPTPNYSSNLLLLFLSTVNFKSTASTALAASTSALLHPLWREPRETLNINVIALLKSLQRLTTAFGMRATLLTILPDLIRSGPVYLSALIFFKFPPALMSQLQGLLLFLNDAHFRSFEPTNPDD